MISSPAGISSTSIIKLRYGVNITTDILVQICEIFNYNITDIMNIINENEQ